MLGDWDGLSHYIFFIMYTPEIDTNGSPMFKQSLRGCSQIHDSTRDGMGLNISNLEADAHPKQIIDNYLGKL